MLTKSALIVFKGAKANKKLMFVLSDDSPYFLFPGGTVEKGEAIKATLRRELKEELSASAEQVTKLGVVTGETVTGRPLTIHLFSGELTGRVKPSAEIINVVWMTKKQLHAHRSQMTPITLNHVLPLLEARGLW